jgi:hypothetical protein
MAQFAIERLDDAFSDLQSMLPAQWAHTGDSEVDCAPNWPLYRQLEQAQAAFLVIARDDGRPVGYMTAFMYPHPNAVSVRVAEIKTYYIEKGRAIVLNSMIDFMLAELAKRGVFKIKAWTHAGHPATRMWQGKGFEISEIGLTMFRSTPPAGGDRRTDNA